MYSIHYWSWFIIEFHHHPEPLLNSLYVSRSMALVHAVSVVQRCKWNVYLGPCQACNMQVMWRPRCVACTSLNHLTGSSTWRHWRCSSLDNLCGHRYCHTCISVLQIYQCSRSRDKNDATLNSSLTKRQLSIVWPTTITWIWSHSASYLTLTDCPATNSTKSQTTYSPSVT